MSDGGERLHIALSVFAFFFVISIEAVFSICSGVGGSGRSMSLLNSSLRRCASWTALLAAMYSAARVLVTTVFM